MVRVRFVRGGGERRVRFVRGGGERRVRLGLGGGGAGGRGAASDGRAAAQVGSDSHLGSSFVVDTVGAAARPGGAATIMAPTGGAGGAWAAAAAPAGAGHAASLTPY